MTQKKKKTVRGRIQFSVRENKLPKKKPVKKLSVINFASHTLGFMLYIDIINYIYICMCIHISM